MVAPSSAATLAHAGQVQKLYQSFWLTEKMVASGRSRIRQREDGARRRDTAQHLFAQRHQRRGALGGDSA